MKKGGGGALLTFNCFFLIFNTKKCFLVTEMMNNISFCWKSRIIQFLKLWSNYQYLNLWEKIESHGHAVSISTIHAFSSSHPSLFIYLFLTGIKKEHLFPFYTSKYRYSIHAISIHVHSSTGQDDVWISCHWY